LSQHADYFELTNEVNWNAWLTLSIREIIEKNRKISQENKNSFEKRVRFDFDD